MRKKYTFLISVFFIEFFIVSILNKANIKTQSWVGNAVGTFIFLFPIQILFFLLGREYRLTKKKRTFFKVAFWFINVCYFLGGIASLLR